MHLLPAVVQCIPNLQLLSLNPAVAVFYLAAVLCPAHDAGHPVVVVPDEREGARVVYGTLGCPECGAEYEVREGVAYLLRAGTQARADEPGELTAVDAMRVAALLGLSEPGRMVGLMGAYADAATAIADATGAVVVTINASAKVHAQSTAEHIVVDQTARVPLTDRLLDALAVDAAHVGVLLDAGRVVKPRGRVLAPADAPVPTGCTVLVRDDREWLAEVGAPESTSAPIALKLNRADR